MVKAVVGANWGDEGKGKITDMLAKEADIIVRFQGGANAGHTIVNDYGKFALHTLPSGVFYGHTTSVIGNGVALNIPVLMKEIQSIVERGVPKPKILVSDRAQMVMPYHILFDQYEEERLGGKSFGSTKSGIAPFYSDKYAKIGFQVSELFDEELLKEKVVRIAETKNVLLEHLYHKPLINPDELLETLHEYRDTIAPYVCDVSSYLDQAIKEGKTILLEGQLGTLKDPDHGIYPMVTSSSTLAAYGAIGAGIPPYEIKKIITEITEKSKLVESTMQENEVLQTEQQEAINRTEEIFGEIMKQIEMLGSGMERINALNDTMSANKDLVVDKMGTIASVSEQSAAATEEVNASTEQVNVTMEEISEHTETLQAIAKDLMETINRFKLA